MYRDSYTIFLSIFIVVVIVIIIIIIGVTVSNNSGGSSSFQNFPNFSNTDENTIEQFESDNTLLTPNIINEELLVNRNEQAFKNPEAFIISMSYDLYDNAKKILEKNNKNNFPELKIFNAIKGKSLPDEYINSITTLRARRDVFISPKRFSHSDIGVKGAIGASLSHASIWLYIVRNKLNGCFVFESDVVCPEIFDFDYLKEFLLDRDGHVFLFGLLTPNIINITKTFKVYRLKDRFYGMHSYFITYEGAKIALKNLFPLEQQIDSYLSDLSLLNLLNVYIMHGSICIQQNTLGSSIGHKKIYDHTEQNAYWDSDYWEKTYN